MFSCRSIPSLTWFIHRIGNDHSCLQKKRTHVMAEKEILLIATHLAIARSRASLYTRTVSSLSECLSRTSINERNVLLTVISCVAARSGVHRRISSVCACTYLLCRKRRTNERTNEQRTLIVRTHSVRGGEHGIGVVAVFSLQENEKGLRRQIALYRVKNSTDWAAYRCVASANEDAECKVYRSTS